MQQCLQAPRLVQPTCQGARPQAAARVQAFRPAQRLSRSPKRLIRSRAEQGVTVSSSSEAQQASDSFVPVLRPEDLPKGTRQEVKVEGKGVLLFWYRNQIYAIEARSPAEGAYSEGFKNAKFTQDYCIECPSTGSLFSLKDGSIVSWYPTNPVLRMLTPQDTCRNLEIYPVRLTQKAIEVDISGSSVSSRSTKGGSNTSLENNNVYGLEPKQYVDSDGSGSMANSATVTVATTTVGLLAVVGTAAAIYFFAFQPLTR